MDPQDGNILSPRKMVLHNKGGLMEQHADIGLHHSTEDAGRGQKCDDWDALAGLWYGKSLAGVSAAMLHDARKV